MNFLGLVAILLFILSSSIFITGYIRSSSPTLRQKRVCLLIAHPDDEAMFFAPTLLALTQPALGNHVRIICFSSGDNEGLGEIRKKELVNSSLELGLAKEDDVCVIDSQDFPDSMTAVWDKKKISDKLFSTLTSSAKNTSEGKELVAPTIDVLITFDSKGVSSHLNHISLYHGAKSFTSLLTQRSSCHKPPVSMYTLTSVSILRKYVSFIDNIIIMATMVFRKKEPAQNPRFLLFLSEPRQVSTAQKAMIKCHQSQMKWFRWGWIFWSRYMTANILLLE